MPVQVLIADDEMHILRAAEFKLKRSGFEVTCVEDGQEAWEAIQKERPDILITDFHMPRMDGLSLCRTIRSHSETADLPIIMLTAKGYDLSGDDGTSELDIAAVLAKPFSPRGLVQCIQEVLETGKYVPNVATF
ncbi:Transcriptional regulatory protein YycF [Bremerella volcania]|uniref:Transcriptional regulatory protein YycF n=1 Tax=Bremerella volcania TaxID=2527984 RepID=A0A518C7A7_9BACT|nr:response regulator [Bremerella volcania]QDU75084.1 Transcriptional regulatory protein YycF [Bremerella volcania]